MVKNEMKSDLEVLTEYYEKTANSAEIFKSLDDKKPAEKVCLMQRDQIGNFYYSNPISQSAVEELELKREISKIKIIPTCTLKRSTSTLASKPKQSVKKLKTGVQFRPVEFKDYGLFTSFAPRFDSGMASLGSRDSTLVCKPFRKAKVEVAEMVTTIPKFESCPVLSSPSPDWKKLNIEFDDILDPHKPVDNESIIKAFNESPLAKDIQIEKILSLPKKLQEARTSKTPEKVDLLLEENKQLLQLLQLHHHQRLLSKDKLVTPQERKTAQMVIDNLQALVAWVKPKVFKQGMDVEDFIFKIQDGREGVFKGTLGNGAKAIHSNQVGPKSFS